MINHYSTYDNYRDNYDKYNKYIMEHIYFVQQVYYKLIKYYNIFPREIKYRLEDHIRHHDKTKTSYREFDGYLQWFYPEDVNKKNEDEFNIALNHHHNFNEHHWEYWVLIKGTKVIPLEMPLEYVLEMLCDWSAMSIKFGGTPSEYYNNTKKDKLLNEKTKETINQYLPIFDDIVENFEVSDPDIYERIFSTEYSENKSA